MTQSYEITHELAQKIIDYLVERPYKEVAALLAEIHKIQPIKQEIAEPQSK